MFNDDNGSGASNLLTFLFGIAVGVVGTFVYAAANEDQFQRAVKRTKELKGSTQDAISDYAEDASAKVKTLGNKVQGGIDSVTSKVKSKATDVADEFEHQAKHAKHEINS